MHYKCERGASHSLRFCTWEMWFTEQSSEMIECAQNAGMYYNIWSFCVTNCEWEISNVSVCRFDVWLEISNWLQQLRIIDIMEVPLVVRFTCVWIQICTAQIRIFMQVGTSHVPQVLKFQLLKGIISYNIVYCSYKWKLPIGFYVSYNCNESHRHRDMCFCMCWLWK